MPRLKTKAVEAAELHAAPAPAVEESKIALVGDGQTVEAVPSPALTLQNDLYRSFEISGLPPLDTDNIEVRKIPIAWTLVGLTVICGAFWAGVWSLFA
ncbi:hypothetical protein [Asticcacaulis solisilvae]|uniref:hypothetical protein n=1 Tax=Asticcacaulis solisilvae TaxID=1217274 RepID=UPI003FD79F33